MFDISVCVPSYKRPTYVETKEYLNFIKVYVAYEEFEEYKKYQPDLEIIQCDKGIQGNISRVRNYIIQKELNKRDAVCIIDDDMKGVYYWERGLSHRVEPEQFMTFLQKYTLMAFDFGVYLWGINVNKDPMVYSSNVPFSTLSYIGSPFMVFLKGNNCWFDETFSLKEDYDMTIQQLNKNRKVLRINKFYYDVKQSKQVGGCSSYRNFVEEEKQVRLLQKKWGKHIVQIDTSNQSKKRKTFLDYNPVIRVPIKGI